MSQWQRVLGGGLTAVWLAAALLVAAPGGASASSHVAEVSPDDVCTVLESLGGADPPSAAAVTAELFDVAGAARSSVARRVIDCITGFDADSPAVVARTDAAICKLADSLNGKERFEESLKLIDGLRSARGDEDLCQREYGTASAGARPNVDAQGLGELWVQYQKNVAQPLAPIALFVSLAAIAILALARLLVIMGLFKDRRSTKWGRRFAFWLGLTLTFIVPAGAAARALWFAYRANPERPAAIRFPAFFLQLLSWAWGWWLLFLGLVIVAILFLAYWFATRRRITIEITPKDDGTGLDGTRLMASIDAVAGRPNSGIEFPVGTDIVDEAKSVTEISDNKFVAAFQAFARLIFGTSPWRLKVENETGNAVSIAISRNGRLKVARRLEISEPPLETIPKPAEVTRLASLVAGEVVAVMAPKYRSELRPGLNGATEAESIAYQYIASDSLSSNRELRERAIPLLHRALAIDPSNRGAAATLRNFIYRNSAGEVVDHSDYQLFLQNEIDNELRQMAVGRPVSVATARATWFVRRSVQGLLAPVPPLPNGSMKIALRRLTRNDFLLRLLQTHAVATRNLTAAGGIGTADSTPVPYEGLYLYLFARLRRPRAAIVLHARRRQLFLIDRFYDLEWSSSTGSAPIRFFARNGFIGRERRAWGRPANADAGSPASRFQREENVLRLWGDFGQDPGVAYALACYRATQWYETYALIDTG
jgi:hypothetical protein